MVAASQRKIDLHIDFDSTAHAGITVSIGIARALHAQRDVKAREHLEHLECSHQPHAQDRGAKKRTQLASWPDDWHRVTG